MADISFYQYLEAAFRYKLKYNTAASFKDLNYNLPYESKGANRGIFEYARKVLPTFYSLHFPDTEEGHLQMARDFIEKLDRHKDAEIERYLDPARTPKEHAQTIAEAKLSLAEARAASQSSKVSQATDAGGLPFGIPAASAPAAPRVSVVQQTVPPGGMEGGPGQGIAATNKLNTPKAFQDAFKNEPDYKLNPAKQPPFATNPGLKFQTGFTNTFKNISSRVGTSFKINSTKVARGLGGIARGAGRRVAGAAGTGLGAAAPHLGRLGHGLASGLQKISQPGIGGGGIGKGLSKSSSKFALAFVGAMLLVVFVGAIGGLVGGTTPTGEAAPLPIAGGGNPAGTSDISNCKFTRGDMNPKEANYKSSILLSYIQEASQKSSIPPAILAAFIRVESPSSSNMSDDQISNYSTNCAQSPTGALGMMQIQPPGTTSARGDPASCDDCINAGAKLVGKTVSIMTREDYCDPRTNIIVGSGWILKKMSLLGLGDGTKWDPGWTNNKAAIETLVNTYYGCLQYGGTADCTGPYNYADDVTTSIQGCQVAPATAAPPPPAGGDYGNWMAQELGIKMNDGFTPDAYKWAYDILYQTTNMAPKFKGLIHQQCSLITLDPTQGISHADSCTIPLSFGSGEKFFKFLLIHELGHKINTTEHRFNKAVISARTADASEDTQKYNGFLSYYSENAASDPDTICGDGDNMGNRADEEFADSVAYYINSATEEQNIKYGQCGVKWPDNPFNEGKRYKQHYELMTNILK